MNIGLDLDEVICQTAQMAIDHLNIMFDCNYGIEIFKSFNFKDNIFSDDEEIQKDAVECLIWAVYDKYMMNTVKPYPSVIKAIKLFKRAGHKIYIITKRPKEFKEMTEVWLHKYNIRYDELVMTDQLSKADFANKFKLDCFVDDLEENLYDMYKARKRWTKGLILITRPWNIDNYIDASKFIRVNNWDDISRIITVGNRLK